MDQLQQLFGVTAVRLGLVTEGQLAEARSELARSPDQSLATWFAEQGWISAIDIERIRQMVIEQPSELSDDDSSTSSGRAWEGGNGAAKSGNVNAKRRSSGTVSMQMGPMPANEDSESEGFFLDPGAATVGFTEAPPKLPCDGHYQLGRLFAEGGLSRIWVAHDESLNRNVALKQIRAELAGNSNARRRFRREAQITGQLEHPNIVPVYELCIGDAKDNDFYYAMRLVKGKSLRQACDEYHASRSAGIDRPLDFLRLLQSFVSVCQAIAYANSRGVIHRDIKPENIILGKFGEVIVLDWGLAKSVGEPPDDEDSNESGSRKVIVTNQASAEQTAVGVVLGTPAYMAPEQAKPQLGDVNERTDVYGLGSTLFAILTGTPPHRGKTIADTLKDITRVPVRRARQENPRVPLALEAICAKATAFLPADRYASAADIAVDIQKYLADEPIAIFQDSIVTKFRRWVVRNRVKFVIIMSILPIITIFLAISNYILFKRLQQSEKSRAEMVQQVPVPSNSNQGLLVEE